MKQHGGQKFTQKMVNQQPVYDKTLKVHRPRKTVKKAGKFL